MYTLFIILILLVSLLMIGIVLVQESKGGGLSSNFSSSNAIMGVRKTTDFIEKGTWTLAALMVVFSVICAYTAPRSVTTESVLEKAATETQQTNPTTTPGFQAGQQTQQGAKGSAPATQQPANAPAAAQQPASAPTAPAK